MLETRLKKKREKRHIFHNKLFIIQIHLFIIIKYLLIYYNNNYLLFESIKKKNGIVEQQFQVFQELTLTQPLYSEA